MGTGGIGEEDYSSVDGQKHIHHQCICAVPGIINQIKKIDDPAVLLTLRNQLQVCCPVDLYNLFLSQFSKLQNLEEEPEGGNI